MSTQPLKPFMLKYPRFKALFQVEILPGDQIALFDDSGKGYQLEGKAYRLLAEYLLGPKRSLQQIATLLKNEIPREELYYAAFRLHQKGFLEEAQSKISKSLSAFCQLLQVPTAEAIHHLEQKTISPHFIGNVSSRFFKKSCRKMSIGCKESSGLYRNNLKNQEYDKEAAQIFASGGSDHCLRQGASEDRKFAAKPTQSETDSSGCFGINVVFTEHYRHPDLKRFHKTSLAHKKPWLLIRPQGPNLWIGPLFIPEITACYECLMFAFDQHHWQQILIEELCQKKNPIGQWAANIPLAEPMAAHLAANEIFKWLVKGSNPAIEGKILSLDLCSMQMQSHLVLKRSDCNSCGFSSQELPPSLELETAPSPPTPPEKIYDQFAHLTSPITGIISPLVKVDSAFLAHNFFSVIQLANLNFIKHFPKAEGWLTASGGKGKSEARAKACCLCEGIERSSGVYQGKEKRKKGIYQEIGQEAIDPRSVLLFSERQYQGREKWNQNCHRFHFIPAPFDEKKQIEWSPLWSLNEKRWKWLPTAFCYFGYVQKQEPFCRADSNGCAAADTKVQAALSGFFELVERDGVALWWYPRLRKPGIDLESFQDPYITELTQHYASIGRKIWALDLTTDLNIPTIAALSSDSSGKEVIFGFGAHLDPRAALTSALLEMHQGYHLTYWQKGKMLFDERRSWLKTATTENQPYLLPSSHLKKASDYKNLANQDPQQNLSVCLDIAAKNRLEILLLDQTRDHIQMPVMRVVVPGLRHFWNRFGAGRLYDIPLKMGWVAQKIKEEDLNPTLMFL